MTTHTPAFEELPTITRHDWHMRMQSAAGGGLTQSQSKLCATLFDSGKWTLRAAMTEVVGREKTEAYWDRPAKSVEPCPDQDQIDQEADDYEEAKFGCVGGHMDEIDDED